MADLTLAGDPTPGDGCEIRHTTAGEAISAGESIVVSSGEALLSDADSATAALNACSGIALNDAADGQPLAYAKSGTVNMGTTSVTVGTVYVVSSTAGGIAPAADLATGDVVSIIGVGSGASAIDLSVVNTGIELPA